MHDPMIPCVREKKRILWKKQEPQKEQAGRKKQGSRKSRQTKKQDSRETCRRNKRTQGVRKEGT